MSDILKEFRRRRKELGLTAKQVAADLNVSPATVTMWETGKRAIPLKRAEEYAEYLGLDLQAVRRHPQHQAWAGCCGEDSSEERCGPVNWVAVRTAWDSALSQVREELP